MDTNYPTLQLLELSKKRPLTPEQIERGIISAMGVTVFSRYRYKSSKYMAVNQIYYYLCCLLAGVLKVKDIPVEAHRYVAMYSADTKCREYALSLLDRIEHGTPR